MIKVLPGTVKGLLLKPADRSAREGSNLLEPSRAEQVASMTCLFKSNRKVLPLNFNNSRKCSGEAGGRMC